MKAFTRRALLVGTGAVLGVAGSRYLANEPISPGLSFPPKTDAAGSTVLNDASLLSPTRVAKHLVLKRDPSDQLIA
ncbi:MAG: FAD-binding oxidoreductase, partial [Aestuariivirgaceae bacterium]